MLAMILAHCHAGSVLPLHLRSKGVSSAGRGKKADRSLKTGCSGGEGFIPAVRNGGEQRDRTDWSKGL